MFDSRGRILNLIRRLASLAFLVLCISLVVKLKRQEEASYAVTLGSGVLAAACLITSAILWVPDLLGIFTAPFNRLIDGIYFGSNNGRSRPELTLRLARSYWREGRLASAVEEYQRQLENHPESLEAWREAIAAAREMPTDALAQSLFAKACAKFTDKESRIQLRQAIAEGIAVPEDEARPFVYPPYKAMGR